MRLVRRLGAGFASGLVLAGVVVQACATGSSFLDLEPVAEGGVDAEASVADSTVLPPKDSGGAEDTGGGETDSGGGSCTTKVVVNELKVEGPGPNDEFVELYNPNTCAVALAGWAIVYQSSAGGQGGAGYVFKSGESIAAKSYYLVASSSFSGKKDATLVTGFAGDKGQVGLVDDKDVVIDGVGYGAITGGDFREGTSASPPPASGSIGRKSDGLDTDDNKADFQGMNVPTPGSAN